MKFAYLILAHGSLGLLKELLKALDAPDNDIYVHIDKKAGNVDIYPFMEIVKQSKLCFLQNRVNVKWGHISIVEATLNLFAEAIKNDYDYLHLLSGVDFPIKSHSYVQKFFQEHRGKEFVGFSKALTCEDAKRRSEWRPFSGKTACRKYSIAYMTNRLIVFLQRRLHLYTSSPICSLRLGAAWFSITMQLAEELVIHRKSIIRRFKYVRLPDEMFLQTYLYEHDYMERVYSINDEFESCCRYIDWNRGRPYVWQDEDFEELVNSEYLWARKFSEENLKLIRKIANKIKD